VYWALTSLCAFFLFAPQAFSTTISLSAASAQAQVLAPQSNLSDTQIGLPTQTSSLGKGFAQVVGTPNPTATSMVNGGNYIATADLSYQFAVLGPKGTVPFFVHGTVSVQGNSGPSNTFYFADSVLTVRSPFAGNPIVLQESACASNGDCTGYCPTSSSCPGIFFNAELVLTANLAYSIELQSYTKACSQQAVCSGISTGFVSALADPSLFIDPSFSGVNDYTLILSEGVGNPVVTPEPSAFVLATGGAAWLIVWRRRASARNRL
jgi:hypothetical protein